MKEANILPEETFFIDDSEANCQAAMSLGIQSHHYHIGENLSSLLNNGNNIRYKPSSITPFSCHYRLLWRGASWTPLSYQSSKRGRRQGWIIFCIGHFSYASQTSDTNHLSSTTALFTQGKLELLETTQIDYCLLLPFTQKLSLLSAREFMQLLRNKFNIHTLVIGYDHRFGHNRSESLKIIAVMARN